MNNLEIRVGNKIEVDGVGFHEIEGGFGKGKKCILAKEIADIHGKKLKRINELINNNKKFFENNVDIIDLKPLESVSVILNDREIYGKDSIRKSKNIYLLSEQGYMLLVKLMDDEKSKKVYKKLVREYFTMREIIKENKLTKEEELALLIFHGGEKGLEASKKLAEIETRKKTKELRDGNNKIISATIAVEMLGIKDLTTTLLHEWFSENNFGEMKLEKSGKKRYFAPNERFFKYVAKEGYSYTGETIKGDKIKAIYSINLVDRLLDRHMKSIVEFVQMKTEIF